MAVLRASAVVKQFETTRALDGVDLVLEPGEVRGLLGPNGAGKTTLLRILFGLVRADGGTLEMFDRPFPAARSDAPADVGGFVEDPSFYPYLTGRANLELLVELDRGVGAERIDGVLDRVRLAARAGDRVSGYSTGMKQRLGIAAALLREPRLLLLDEPTGGLDPEGAREVGVLLRELADAGTSILVSSHQIGEVEEVCDSFTMLKYGKVVWDGTIDQLHASAPAGSYRLVSSDDAQALRLAAGRPSLHAQAGRGGIEVSAEQSALDSYVLDLGRAGVAVRRLEIVGGPLESLFFALTGDGAADARP